MLSYPTLVRERRSAVRPPTACAVRQDRLEIPRQQRLNASTVVATGSYGPVLVRFFIAPEVPRCLDSEAHLRLFVSPGASD